MSGETEPTMSRLVAPGILLVVLTAVVSGVSTFVNTFAVQGTNSDAFITVRNLLVAGMLVPLFLLGREAGTRRLARRDWGRLLVIGLVGGAVPFVLFFRGLQVAGAGALTAQFGYRSLFLIAGVLGIVVLKERASWRAVAAAGAILAGNAALIAFTGPVWTDGTALVLAATVLWAVEYAVSKRALRDLPGRTVALARMGIGGLFLLGYLGASGQLPALASFTGAQVQWIGISGILLLAFVGTWYAGLKHVDLHVATAVLTLGFPVAAVLRALAGSQGMTAAQAAGAAAVAFGACLAVGLASMRETWAYLAARVAARLRSAT